MNLYPARISWSGLNRDQIGFLNPEKYLEHSSSMQIYVLGVAIHNILHIFYIYKYLNMNKSDQGTTIKGISPNIGDAFNC